MGAVKSLATDSLGDLISYANAIARDRDRYQDEARRLRDDKAELVNALRRIIAHSAHRPGAIHADRARDLLHIEAIATAAVELAERIR